MYQMSPLLSRHCDNSWVIVPSWLVIWSFHSASPRVVEFFPHHHSPPPPFFPSHIPTHTHTHKKTLQHPSTSLSQKPTPTLFPSILLVAPSDFPPLFTKHTLLFYFFQAKPYPTHITLFFLALDHHHHHYYPPPPQLLSPHHFPHSYCNDVKKPQTIFPHHHPVVPTTITQPCTSNTPRSNIPVILVCFFLGLGSI